MKKIKRNLAKCLICEDVIESLYRHDFVSCSCGNIFTDGGREYIRQGAYKFDKMKDVSEYFEE